MNPPSIEPTRRRPARDLPGTLSRNARWVGFIIALAMVAFVVLERI